MFNEGESVSKIIKSDYYLGKNTSDIVDELNSKGINPVVIGNGDKIIKQYPNKGTILVNNYKVFLVTDGEVITMPNITGWSRNDVVRLCKLLGIDYKINGTGYVVSQSIPEGSQVSGIIEVNLENRS